jgi:hypothetical protein
MIPINIHIQHLASLKGVISNMLPKAAARRRALPSQRKPSRCIIRNTMAQKIATLSAG